MVTILVADDSAMARLLVSRSLAGHRVLLASAGDEALALARQYRPEVAILDWMMPGLNGIEVCEAIRAAPDLASMHIIVMTARSEHDSRCRALAAGADGFVAKPIIPRQIADLIGAVLATPRTPPDELGAAPELAPACGPVLPNDSDTVEALAECGTIWEDMLLIS